MTCGVNAYTFQCRFVERIGNTDVVLANNRIDVAGGSVHNIRIQFGVFDDSASLAPDGGFLGWNIGTMNVSGSRANSDERRNPGRLSPFNFSVGANANGNPPLPGGDPFTMLTEIDATLGTQAPAWICDAQGNVPPQPEAVVRGRNVFVSVFAFSINPIMGANSYFVDVGGNLIAATTWLTIGTPTPPSCGDPADPMDDVPGTVLYAPNPTPPQLFGSFLVVNIVPTPSVTALLAFGFIGIIGRDRPSRAPCTNLGGVGI